MTDADMEVDDWPSEPPGIYRSSVPTYQATLTLSDGTRHAGIAVLRTITGRRIEWRGSFAADDGSPIRPGSASIEFDGKTADVLIQDWRFEGGKGTAVLLGQGDPPF